MASVSRAFQTNTSGVSYYEERARAIGEDLKSEVSLDAMNGFQLLSFHYWGQDIDKSEHLRSVVISMGSQLAKSSDLSFNDKQKLLQIVLSTIGAQHLDSLHVGHALHFVLEDMKETILSVARKEEGGEDLSPASKCLTIKGAILWLKMKANFSACINRSSSIGGPVFIGRLEDANRLRKSVLETEPLIWPFQSSSSVTCALLRGLMSASLDVLNQSLYFLWEAVRLFWVERSIVFGANAPMLLHLGFRIAVVSEDIYLAYWLSQLQMSLSEELSDARRLYEEEANFLPIMMGLPSYSRPIGPPLLIRQK